MYWSRYDENVIAALAGTLDRLSTAAQVWCVFDNTASGAALENAWELRERLRGKSGGRRATARESHGSQITKR
jgi:uncharacterized protein YecE (DUF72 family)